MKYDFTSILDRRGKDALAIDAIGTTDWGPGAPREGIESIPMWVADMNFPVLPAIQEAMIRRIQHPTFGYFYPTDAYYKAIIDWQERRNGVTGLKPEHIGYENGVLGGVVTALNVLCSRGDKVLVHSPTYVGFTASLKNNGYDIVHSPLNQDENGIWRMDFADMEKKIVDNKIHAAIFCSPHNPTGRVWERWEIQQAMELFRKHDVNVISDEIWSDILRPGVQHIPTQSVSEDAKMRTLAMYAPSKTFSLAGLVGSYHIIYNKALRDRHDKESSLSHYNSMNVLSMHALIGAYSEEGHEWVAELNETIAGNVDYVCEFIAQNFPGVTVSKPQGTYMLFVDCKDWLEAHGKTMDQVLHAGWEAGVAWQDGRNFHGKTHLRLNLALPLSRVQEACRRMKESVFVD
ncbi:MAG: aminotransferase class I/II-fold pyridoxal phosphate-dependent enzyme [Clostridia bacterium]|nr:aminotransferase class I/II-fold pyridoxal phosphate-dependent enzyme [Clostridia bacterium]